MGKCDTIVVEYNIHVGFGGRKHIAQHHMQATKAFLNLLASRAYQHINTRIPPGKAMCDQ